MTKKETKIRVQVPLVESLHAKVNKAAIRNNRSLGCEAAHIIGLHVNKQNRNSK